MTLTIEIPDDTAARACVVAASQGQDLGTFAVALISGAASEETIALERKPLPWDEFFALMADGIDPNLPPLSDYAISREGIYEDHL